MRSEEREGVGDDGERWLPSLETMARFSHLGTSRPLRLGEENEGIEANLGEGSDRAGRLGVSVARVSHGGGIGRKRRTARQRI